MTSNANCLSLLGKSPRQISGVIGAYWVPRAERQSWMNPNTIGAEQERQSENSGRVIDQLKVGNTQY
jgi:hypothetical protein